MEAKAAVQDFRWYAGLVEKVVKVTDKAKLTSDAADSEEHARGFDAAEAMEVGEARCLAFLVSQRQPVEQRLFVVRSPQQRTTCLVNAAGEALLMSAASEDGCRFSIFVSHDGTPPLASKSYFGRADMPEPAFALVASDRERNDWVLEAMKCERCTALGRRRCGSGRIARMRHYSEPVGAGAAFCMDVQFPASAGDGSRAVFCDVCGDPSTCWSSELTSRRPNWNMKHKTLSLDFRGRATMASAKNFQLDTLGSDRKASDFLYGKVAEQKFVLDYCSPLSMVQAYAAALSVSHWQ